MRLLPNSLAGQLAAALAVALLITQSLNFLVLLQSRERVRAVRDDSAIGRFVALADRDRLLEQIDQRRAVRTPRWARHVSVTDAPLADKYAARAQTTNRLRRELAAADLPADGALAATGPGDILSGRPRPGEDRVRMALVLSAPLSTGKWLNVAQPLPPQQPMQLAPLIFQTLLTYGVLLAGVLFIVRRIARPLAGLTDAAETLMTPQAPAQLPLEGPEDLQSLTRAFEAMRTRIEGLFQEKDVMLGAIGHDLRTPLTSLRIRAEGIDDVRLRDQMIATIEEMTLLLDDILNLARQGQTRGQDRGETAEIQIRVLMDEVAHAFPQAADRLTLVPVSGAFEGYPVLIRRALRNLVENGLRYGEQVTLSAARQGDEWSLMVEDDGPGVPDADLGTLKDAFVTQDASRNKASGGSGLGLALAEGVAGAHGGRLELSNRAKGGFRAVLVVPA